MSTIIKGICLFILFLFFIFVSDILAVTIQISGAPATLSEEEEFSLNVAIQGSKSIANKNYYLEAAFTKKDSSPSYFGWTKNNNEEWYNHGSNFSDFYKITMSPEASWSGTLKVKPDLTDSSFKGSDDYWLSVFRYTEGGSKGSDDCNQLLVFINHQESDPSPNPSPSPQSTSPSPSPSPSISPFPSPTPISATPPPSLSPEPSPTESNNKDEETDFTGEVFGATENSEEEDENNEEKEEEEKKKLSIPLIISITGIVFLGAASFPVLKPKLNKFLKKRRKFKKRKKDKNKNIESFEI